MRITLQLNTTNWLFMKLTCEVAFLLGSNEWVSVFFAGVAQLSNLSRNPKNWLGSKQMKAKRPKWTVCSTVLRWESHAVSQISRWLYVPLSPRPSCLPYGPILLRNIREVIIIIFFQRNLRFLSVFLSPSVLKYKNEYRSLCISTVVVKCDWLSEAVTLVSDLS